MTSEQLRLIRRVCLLLIFLLGAFYASQWFVLRQFVGNDSSPGGPVPATEIVRFLPDFALSDLDGTTRPISEWTDRPLIINFWATWCAPCRREMPLLQTLHLEREDEPTKVIGIAIDRLNAVEAFVAESGVTYTILAGQQDALRVAEQFGPDFIVLLPFTVFTAPGGEVLLLHSGELHADQLRRILKITDQVTEGSLAPSRAREMLADAPASAEG